MCTVKSFWRTSGLTQQQTSTNSCKGASVIRWQRARLFFDNPVRKDSPPSSLNFYINSPLSVYRSQVGVRTCFSLFCFFIDIATDIVTLSAAVKQHSFCVLKNFISNNTRNGRSHQPCMMRDLPVILLGISRRPR